MAKTLDSDSISGIKGVWVLAAAILGSSITFIDGTVVNVALPVLQEKLGASVAEIQWVVESYALMLSALILVGGVMGDKYGRKLIFSIGTSIFAVSSLWCGLVSGATGLIIARGVQGIGAALLVPGSLAIISAVFPKKERAAAIGTWSAFTAIAAGFGPVLGGWLIEYFSWRWIFFINLPIAAIVLLITLATCTRNIRRSCKERLGLDRGYSRDHRFGRHCVWPYSFGISRLSRLYGHWKPLDRRSGSHRIYIRRG